MQTTFKQMKKYILILLMSLTVLSCSKFQRIMKSSDMEAKYTAAVEYYNDDDYYRALQLFEELISVYRGSAKAESIYYYYAYCYYGTGDLYTAAYHFNNYAITFSKNDKAEECSYMSAYCYYLMSPKSSLDQTNSKEAINRLQSFVNRYPKSDRIEKCNALIDDLRDKLEMKTFENAKNFYKRTAYKAALVSFENLIKEYPGSKYVEECYIYIIRSSYDYASYSIDARKEERFNETLANCLRYRENYAEGKFINECNNLERLAKEQLKKISDDGKIQGNG